MHAQRRAQVGGGRQLEAALVAGGAAPNLPAQLGGQGLRGLRQAGDKAEVVDAGRGLGVDTQAGEVLLRGGGQLGKEAGRQSKGRVEGTTGGLASSAVHVPARCNVPHGMVCLVP